MKTTKTTIKTDVSFFKDEKGNAKLSITLPKSWDELTQPQLHYVCVLLSLGIPRNQIKIYCFIRFSGLDVIANIDEKWHFRIRTSFFRHEYFTLTEQEVAWAAEQMNFLEETPDIPVRIAFFGRYNAVNNVMHGVIFRDYLKLDNWWQQYVVNGNELAVLEVAKILYRDREGISPRVPDNVMCISSVLWMTSFKKFCSAHWPHLFAAGSGSENAPINMEQMMNNQIRALTQGDVTKEKEILELDVWRALTELDAKAHEADEQRKELAKIKK